MTSALGRVPGLAGLHLHHFYPALTYVAHFSHRVVDSLFARFTGLFTRDPGLVLWDTTMVRFEGRRPAKLAQYGNAEDKRTDRRQMVVGVLVTGEGWPLAHAVYPGHVNDVTATLAIIGQLKRRFAFRKVFFVADRGAVGQQILAPLEKVGLEYIVGMQMRRVRVRAFRELKSTLEMRPAHVWTDEHVRGHVALCFWWVSISSRPDRPRVASGSRATPPGWPTAPGHLHEIRPAGGTVAVLGHSLGAVPFEVEEVVPKRARPTSRKSLSASTRARACSSTGWIAASAPSARYAWCNRVVSKSGKRAGASHSRTRARFEEGTITARRRWP